MEQICSCLIVKCFFFFRFSKEIQLLGANETVQLRTVNQSDCLVVHGASEIRLYFVFAPSGARSETSRADSPA